MRIRALVISASVPPFNDSSSIQLMNRIRLFKEYGIQTILIGPKFPELMENDLSKQLGENVEILRTDPTVYDKTIARLRKLPKAHFIIWIYSNIIDRIAIPDVRTGWDRQVIYLCKQMCSNLRPDIIITHSGSYTAHIAGKYLSQQFHVPWIIDMGDPLSFASPRSLLGLIKSYRNKIVELNTIPYASGIVFTTETTLTAYKSWLGEKLPEAIVIPAYGYSSSDFYSIENSFLSGKNTIVISYIGTAYRKDRNLLPLIFALKDLCQSNNIHHFTLNIIGSYSYFFERRVKRLKINFVNFKTRISFEESISWINKSHILVLVGNKSPLQIPAKVFLYLGSGRPILYLGQLPIEQDPTASLLLQFSGVILTRNEKSAIISAIQEIDLNYEKLIRDSLERLKSPRIKEFESNEVSKKFVEFTLSIYNKHRRK